MNKKDIESLRNEVKNKSADETVRWATSAFGADFVALASSFGAEDQALTDMLIKSGARKNIFTLDTGHLPRETLDALEATQKHYAIIIEVLRPAAVAVEEMVKLHGPDLFYESVEKRKLCCRVRKVEPLEKKLKHLKAWICGLRREQSAVREQVQKIEWDESFGLFKINPLADWTTSEVWDYIQKNNVPYNKLHDKGYPSIGCAPCTRAVKPGEDIRAGRWWWERADGGNKECGLHAKSEAPVGNVENKSE
ncbi:MAG: phosphoadenylyl-sulfate reductase [Endomicrobiia bacterium]|nr:phosphoadenylyl-sulfate reductase [Endomicrobiia bacterium]